MSTYLHSTSRKIIDKKNKKNRHTKLCNRQIPIYRKVPGSKK